ncbi:hypothetical protein EDC19_0672 [Natranaerovirga hydrolytica]|uniref:Sporulation protein YqfD n=1 Tax=Natranaerovirga hydrolytica TaxID=680378 RepID=A0A4R1N084_9FIRM|nr:sporulation protein YqfD [Natranaerovirga hydrolytica]TCK98252.1 hypothetical protein EDC19_0672 [Natranaerovirga hydrolytica]
MINFIKFIKGFLVVEVKGFSPERFINLCANKKILIWQLKKNKNAYTFCISVKGYKLLKPIVRKTNTKIKIVDKIGLPFFFYKYRKRKLFFMGIGVFVSFIYILSLFIWRIEFVGNYTYTDELLLKYLSSNDYKVGMKKTEVISSEIEKRIMKDFQDISWASIEVNGTKMILHLQETLERHEDVAESIPSDIIAEKDGVITSIVTRKGMPMVVEGDVVVKGDVLVTGDLLIKMEEVLRDVEFVHADGDIYAQTIYHYEDEVPLYYQEKVFTGKTQKGYTYNFFNNNITLYHPRIKLEEYDTIIKNKTYKIGKNFFLPVEQIKTEYREYYMADQYYTLEEATNLLNHRLNKYIKELEEKGVQILENNVKIKEENDVVILEGQLVLIERIGIDQPINISERRIEYEDEIIREDDGDTQ